MSNVFIVARPIADMDATGTGIVEKVTQASHTHTGVEYEYRADVAIASELFTSITWADINTEGAIDASSGSARFDISMNKTLFAAALAGVIRTAVGGKLAAAGNYATAASANTQGSLAADPSNLGSAAKTAQTILDREVRLEVEALLNVNGVLEYLEGDSLGQFSLSLDASGGAEDMADRLGDDQADLRNFFLQIPNRPTLYDTAGVSGEQADSGSLPVMVGDTLGFVFDIDTEVTISEPPVDAGAIESVTGTAPALGVTGTLANPYVSGTLSTANRRAIFIVTVTA